MQNNGEMSRLLLKKQQDNNQMGKELIPWKENGFCSSVKGQTVSNFNVKMALLCTRTM